jgi:ribosome recycling factor
MIEKDYKAYYEKNKDKLKANAKKWAEEHKEEIKAYRNNYKKGINKGRDRHMTEEERRKWLEYMNNKEINNFNETGEYQFFVDKRG